MIKHYPITAKTSTVNGDLGTKYDWSKFDWTGKSIKVENCHVSGCDHTHEYKSFVRYQTWKVY